MKATELTCLLSDWPKFQLKPRSIFFASIENVACGNIRAYTRSSAPWWSNSNPLFARQSEEQRWGEVAFSFLLKIMTWKPIPNPKILAETIGLSHAERKVMKCFFFPACRFGSWTVSWLIWVMNGLWKYILNLHWEQISLPSTRPVVSPAFPRFGYRQTYTHALSFSTVSEWIGEGRIWQATVWVSFYSQYSFPEELCVTLSKCWTNPLEPILRFGLVPLFSREFTSSVCSP